MSPGLSHTSRIGLIASSLAVAMLAVLTPGAHAQAVDSTCRVHLQSGSFVGPTADLSRILDLLDTTSHASFAIQRAGRGRNADTCAAPAVVQRLAHSLAIPDPSNGVQLLPAELLITGNSAYPRDWNDGMLWSGRGLNASFTTGARFRWGPFSAAVAPVVAWQANADFSIRPQIDTARSEFASGTWALNIDQPQRFGTETISTLDAGQSYARIDVLGFAAGLSSESIRWGPSLRNPLLLSGTSAGFAHAFIEAARPHDIWIGDLQFQLIWGRLEESEYFDNDPDNDQRMLAGVLVAFQPRVMEGLTVGGARVQELTWWPELSLGDVVLGPYRGVSANQMGRSGDNQLISFFFRWATAPAGLEVYGEWARDDHWGKWIELFRNLDASQAWTLGLQKVVRLDDSALRLTAEVTHLSDALPIRFAGRAVIPFYSNTAVNQGHTHHGQLLGAPIGTGGETLFIGADYFWRAGRTSLSVERARYEDDYYNLAFADRYGAHARDTEASIRAGHLVAAGALSVDAAAGWSLRFNRSFLGLETLPPGASYRREVNWSMTLGARWTP